MNFTYVQKKSRDLQWGAMSANGTWNGMIKDILEKKADIGTTDKDTENIYVKQNLNSFLAVSCFSITEARNRVVSFGLPLHVTYNGLFIKIVQGSICNSKKVSFLECHTYFQPFGELCVSVA